MAVRTDLRKRYNILHRYMSGLTVFCIIVTVMGSALAGASTVTIAVRAGMVAFAFFLSGRVLIKIWASWEEIQHSSVAASDD